MLRGHWALPAMQYVNLYTLGIAVMLHAALNATHYSEHCHAATHCIGHFHTATHCLETRHTATHCIERRHAATRCIENRCTATQCIKHHLAATHCNEYCHVAMHSIGRSHIATHCISMLLHNGAEKTMTQVYTCTTFKRIELESPDWSGFVENSKPDHT